jgi:hypothetical protein
MNAEIHGVRRRVDADRASRCCASPTSRRLGWVLRPTGWAAAAPLFDAATGSSRATAAISRAAAPLIDASARCARAGWRAHARVRRRARAPTDRRPS